MHLRQVLAVLCAGILMMGLSADLHTTSAASDTFQRIISISAPNTADGCINPLACLDASQAPFQKGGPFSVSGYYRFHKIAGMPKGTSNIPSASVFGISVSDTGGQWKPFTASFSTADSLSFQGILLWYMAGELSMAGLTIKNAAGEVVYDMESDTALTATDSTALLRKSIWYLWFFGNDHQVRFTVTAPEAPLGLIKGSCYKLQGTMLSGVPFGSDVLTVRSNFTKSEEITAWRGNKKLSDTDRITADTVFIYRHGKTDAVSITLAPLSGDYNSDGKIDIRDLRIVKESSFGDFSPEHLRSVDINGDLRIDNDDISLIRDGITGSLLYSKQSIGAEALLAMANPVGRLHKSNQMLFMEHSASNFTLSGQLQGDVTATVWVEQARSPADQHGLFIEVDGIMRYEKISACSKYIHVTLAKNLIPGKHTIRVYKATDAANDITYINTIQYSGQLTKSPVAERRIEFLGDSITAGIDVFPIGSAQHQKYGAATSYFSYAKKTADLLGASHYSVANSGWRLCYTLSPLYTIRSVYPYRAMGSAYNGGEYAFDFDPQVVVINLGTNDRFTADSATYQKDVTQLLQIVRQKNPQAAIFWAYGAMDAGHGSNQWIRAAVNAFAASDGNAYYVPLPQNNLGANMHPNEAGQDAIAKTLADAISKVMGW